MSEYTYKPLAPLLWTFVVVAALGLCADLLYLALGVAVDDPVRFEELGSFVMLASGAFIIVRAITFGAFLYRANANVRALGEGELKVSPWGMIGWFFVPFASLYKPFQAVRDLFAYTSGNVEDRINQRAPGIVATWWAVFIITQVFENFSGMTESTEGTIVGAVGSVASFVTTALLLFALRARIDAFASRVKIDDEVVATFG